MKCTLLLALREDFLKKENAYEFKLALMHIMFFFLKQLILITSHAQEVQRLKQVTIQISPKQARKCTGGYKTKT